MKNEECRGCYSLLLYSINEEIINTCTLTSPKTISKNKEYECPYATCLVKTMCHIGCNVFEEYFDLEEDENENEY